MRRCRKARKALMFIRKYSHLLKSNLSQASIFLLVTLIVLSFTSSTALPTSLPFSDLLTGPPSHRPSQLSSGFVDRTKAVGLDKIPGSAIAVADINQDRYFDLILLDTTTLNSISIAIWDNQAYRFKQQGDRLVLGEHTNSEDGPTKVEEVLAVDFNMDGAVDFLVRGNGKAVLVNGVPGFPGRFNSTASWYLEGSILGVVDLQRDLAPDIFVYKEDGSRGFYVNDGHGAMSYKPWNNTSSKDCALARYNPPQFIDMDGDCLPDFVVPSSCGIEIYTNVTNIWEQGEETAHKIGKGVYNPSEGDGEIVLADFDATGSVDILVPNSERNDIYVYISNRTVFERGELCKPDPYFNFTKVLGLDKGLDRSNTHFGSLLFSKVHVPPLIRVGDFNMDGFPDLLFVDSRNRPKILRNKRMWGRDAVEHFGILDDKATRSLKTATKGKAAVAATFWDTGESGQQDMLLTDRRNSTRLIMSAYGKSGDGMFFKGTLLQSASQSAPSAYASAPGATFKMAYATRDSPNRRVRVCGQCPMLGWAMLPCACEFGLGSISNYIEELAIGTGRAVKLWTNLMPNSMAIVKANSVTFSEDWRMEYFAQARGAQLLAVVSILFFVMTVLGAVILWLQNLERKENSEAGNFEREQLFHFGA